jgi:sigma-B regulation protein RsbU (phosphoserine phosphatase)
MQETLRQLETVGEMQRRRLPHSLPQPVGWRVAVHAAAGTWPGGDYYDVFRLSDHRLLVVVADASDHGGPAAVMAAMVRLLLHSCPLSSGAEQLPFCPFRDPLVQPPHVLLGHLNRVLAENVLEGQYVTAFCGLLDPMDGTFHYANAGLPAPRRWRASGGRVEALRDAVGRPLGVDHGATYHPRRMVVGPGDVLAFCSGGLLAARDGQGRAFDWERLDDALREAAPGGAEAVRAAVRARLNDFLAGRAPEDDLTLLVIGRQGEGKET